MNQSQRKFLIDKIKGVNHVKIQALEKSLPEKPSLEGFIMHQILSKEFKLASMEDLRMHILDKAMNLKKGKTLLGGGRWDEGSNSEIRLDARKFFIIPDDYKKLVKEYSEEYLKIRTQIDELRAFEEMLVIRLQLASNSKLEKMINEVDDFGDLSLFDTKLKLSPAPEVKKLNE